MAGNLDSGALPSDTSERRKDAIAVALHPSDEKTGSGSASPQQTGSNCQTNSLYGGPNRDMQKGEEAAVLAAFDLEGCFHGTEITHGG